MKNEVLGVCMHVCIQISGELESGGWPTPAKQGGTGCILGDMLFKLPAPQALKCPANAVQSLGFGEIGKFASKITKFYATGGNACIFGHIYNLNSYQL